MIIDWGLLGQVFVIAFGAAVGIIVLFSLGVAALGRSNYLVVATHDSNDQTGAGGLAVPKARHPGAAAVAGLCFLVCALAIVYGLYLIIAK